LSGKVRENEFCKVVRTLYLISIAWNCLHCVQMYASETHDEDQPPSDDSDVRVLVLVSSDVHL